MSNIPTPTAIPPTPQQVAGALNSALISSQTLIQSDPRYFAPLRDIFLSFHAQPTFQMLLGLPSHSTPATPPQSDQLKAELLEMKSSIQALSKAVTDLQPKVQGAPAPSPPTKTPPPKGKPGAQGKGPTQTPTPTYASKAALLARPSLVLELGVTNTDNQFEESIIASLNSTLAETGYDEVKISALRYTKKGNLVLTAHHDTTQTQLSHATSAIQTFFREVYADSLQKTFDNIQSRANVRWSKILINSVHVRIADHRGPYTLDECHRSLVAHNPSYAALKVTQKPSWVRPPSTYKASDRSSLVFAFEDPDGSAWKLLLASKQLFILGTRAKVTYWKETPRSPPTNPTPTGHVTAVVAPLSGTPEHSMSLDPQDPTPASSKRKFSATSPKAKSSSAKPKKKWTGPQE